MSVLVQRPHQMPGVIVLPRHNSSSSPSNHRNRPAQPQRHNQSPVAPAQVAVLSTTAKPSRRQRGQLQQPPSSSSPLRSTPNKNDKRRSHNNAQQTVSDSPSNLPSDPSSVSIISGNSFSSSSATVSASQSPVLSSASSVISSQPAITATTTPARKGGRQQTTPKSAPNTPTPANSLPVPANRRRARSPRPTQKLPGLNLNLNSDDLDDDFAPAKKNNKKNAKVASNVPATTTPPHEPATWQQAALLKQSQTPGVFAPLMDPVTAVAPSQFRPSYSNPPSPTRTTPPKGSVFDIANEFGLTHSATMPNLSTPARRTGGMHARAPSVPAYSSFTPAAKPVSSLDALFSGLAMDSAPATPASKPAKAHARGQSVSSSLPPSNSLHARMAAAAAATSAPSSASRRERTLTGNNAGYIKFAGASFQTAPDAMMLPRPAFGGMLARKGSSQSGGSSDEDEGSSESDENIVNLSEEEETGVFAF